MNAVQRKISDELSRDGIAFTTLDELFPGESMLATLLDDMNKRSLGGERTKKKYLRSYWEEDEALGLDNPFFAVSLRPEVLAIVNTYDKMWRQLHYLALQETIPVGDEAPVQSQRWHRDPEEKRMVKMFIYMSEVDAEAGPFTFVKRSQFGSPVYGSLFKQELPLGVYPPADRVEAAVSPADIISAQGKPGTVIFCDTAGLHRGGYAKSKSRFMFTAFYPSRWWTEARRMKVSNTVDRSSLSPEAQYAIRGA
jgi:hypothetical protein